jgi:hypothetical protein
MSVFSPANVARAIERIPRTDTATLRKWLALARREKLDALAAACERELELRPVEMTGGQAEKHANWSEHTRDMPLGAAIEYAFTELPARDYEVSIIGVVARHPGVTYPELVKSHRNRDAALVLGHCVYDRFGCLKHWAEGKGRMSDILFERGESGGHVRYRLTEDARAAFAALGMI